MQFQSSFLLFLALVAANAHGMEVTPIQKVATLLTGMLEKGKKEILEEQVAFAATKEGCSNMQDAKKNAIADEEDKIGTLAAGIQKDGAAVAHLSNAIADLNQNIDGWNGEVSAAKKERATEKADFDALHKDLSESINAVERAVAVLSKGARDRAQASFAQVSSLQNLKRIPDDAKKTINAFLEQGNGFDPSAPDVNAYESRSGGVTGMLENLLKKFSDERAAAEKEEVDAKHAHSMLVQDLQAQIKSATHDKDSKTATKAKRLESKADKTADKQATEALKADDVKFLDDFVASCNLKSSDYENRQKLRTEEISVLEQAIEITSGGAVAGNSQLSRASLLQKTGTSLSQLRSSLNKDIQQRALKFLQAQAEKLHSSVLATVAMRAAGDPFAKVKQMVKDLVVRLEEEAAEESDHKGYCDDELKTNSQTRKDKTEAVETLNADIDSLTATIAKLRDDSADLSNAISELDKASAAATETRKTEKAENRAAIKDAQEGQTAVAQALTVLREFYAKAAEATSFVQTTAPYKGQEGSASVVNFLEIIESDFARVESETETAEADAAKEFDSFTSDSNTNKATKTVAAEHTAAKLQQKTGALTEKKADLKGTQSELDSALAYFEKLKPSCVDSGVSYKDRKAQREEEIASLQNAVKILNGEDI